MTDVRPYPRKVTPTRHEVPPSTLLSPVNVWLETCAQLWLQPGCVLYWVRSEDGTRYTGFYVMEAGRGCIANVWTFE